MDRSPRQPAPAATRRALRIMPRVALLALAGCGVAGRPLPPGPVPPAAPALAEGIATPEGVVLTLAEPLRDLDGQRIPEGPETELWAYTTADCVGTPAARGPLAGVTVPPERLAGPVRVVAVRAGRVGQPSAPHTLRWTPPPPPPEAPLAFADGAGQVQLSWLPPDPPVVEIQIWRGDQAIGRAPAEAALWSDDPGPGTHHYTLVGLAPGQRTGPSPAAQVEVAPEEP